MHYQQPTTTTTMTPATTTASTDALTNEFESMFVKAHVHSPSLDDHFILESNHADGIEAFNNNNNNNNNSSNDNCTNHGVSDDDDVDILHDFSHDDIGVPGSPHSGASSPGDDIGDEGFTPPSSFGHQIQAVSSRVPEVPDFLSMMPSLPVQQQKQSLLSIPPRPQQNQMTLNSSNSPPSFPSASGPQMGASATQQQQQLHATSFLPQHLTQTQAQIQSTNSQKRPNNAILVSDEERVRLLKRQKNNEAAHKCRLKKKQQDEVNLGRNRFLEDENAALKKELERLQTETKCLKEVILTLSAKNK